MSYAHEISDGEHTARVSVDSLSDGDTLAMLQIETTDGPFRAVSITLTPEVCDAMMNMLGDAANLLEDKKERAA